MLTHHAVAAADAPRAARYAEQAGYDATRAGAHTEASAFFQIALSHHQGSVRERAVLLTQLAFEQYMTNNLDQAIASITATFPLWDELGDAAGLSSAHERCAVYEYYNARRRQAEALVDQAADLAPDSGADPAQGTAWATRAFLAYMRNDVDRARRGLDDAAREARSS